MNSSSLHIYSYDRLVDELVDRDRIGWTEVFRTIWSDTNRRRYVSMYAYDMMTRGAVIPIEVQCSDGGDLRVVDGHLRVHAAWILRLDEVPVRVTQINAESTQ